MKTYPPINSYNKQKFLKDKCGLGIGNIANCGIYFNGTLDAGKNSMLGCCHRVVMNKTSICTSFGFYLMRLVNIKLTMNHYNRFMKLYSHGIYFFSK